MQSMDEKLGRMVTRVVLPRVIMHSRHHYGVSFPVGLLVHLYLNIFIIKMQGGASKFSVTVASIVDFGQFIGASQLIPKYGVLVTCRNLYYLHTRFVGIF